VAIRGPLYKAENFILSLPSTWSCKDVEFCILIGQRRSARSNWVDFHRARPTFEAHLALVEDEGSFLATLQT
jgi:hypothetical protein